jgi:hypothetical protein
MKKVFFIFGMLLSLGMFSACGSDDETGSIDSGMEKILGDSLNYETTYDLTGRMWYSETNDQWVILYGVPGTIDECHCYYTLNLPDEFKENGIDVSFSGKVVEMTDEDIQSLQIVLLGGHHYYYVYLTKIKKI